MQFFFENLRLAFDALVANKLRSFLTILCVVISIMSIIAVVSIVQGMDQFVKTKIAQQGSNVFTVQKYDGFLVLTDFDAFLKALKNPDITLEDLELLRKEIPLAEFVDASINRRDRLTAATRLVENVGIRGRTEEYPAIGDFPLAYGRHLSRIDVLQRRNNCVIGWEIAETLFPYTTALGKTVKIGAKHFNVVGVCEKKGNILGNNQNLFAFIPVTTFLKQYGSRQSLEIQIRTEDMESFAEAMQQTRTALRVDRGLKPSLDDNFHIDTSEQLVSIWEAISVGIFGTLIGVVSITLVVGGIIIMNVMLVAVTERTREIGIRKSVGARRGHIVFQFLLEALILTGIGGAVGILLGFTIASIVAALTPLPYYISAVPIVTALIISFGVGVFFGVYPAQKASRLDPVVALRQ
ncbi:MAG: ABC transporter permease [Deferribacteres bacterium]|nr:ABC transporter permease [candidate division KSB1 bacterium]MCB9501173.1 ABC transporter permease [Deferribacteres bacterium]